MHACKPKRFRASLVILWISTFGFMLYMSHTAIGLWANAGHDDRWHMSQAMSLARGQWFGGFSQFTIMKGPGYSFFLLLNSWLGWPIQLSHGLFHVACAWLFGWVVGQLAGKRWLRVAVTLLLTWHPIFAFPRVIRDAIYPGQTFLVLALWASVLMIHTAGRRQRIALCVAAGISTGWFWLTREEGIWLVPALTCLTLGAFVTAQRSRWRERGLSLVILLIAWFATVQLVAGINYVKYDGWVAVDTREKNFVSVLSLLSNIVSDSSCPIVVVPQDVREKVAAISPTFASLQPHFEKSASAGWAVETCQNPLRRDFNGGGFMWVLRDGAEGIGHYQSEATASAFYGEIARDIKNACASGKLQCHHAWLNYIPHMSGTEIAAILPTMTRGLGEMLNLNFVNDEHLYSMGPIGDVLEFVNHPRMWPMVSEDHARPPSGTKRLMTIRIALKHFYRKFFIATMVTSALSIGLAIRRRSRLNKHLAQTAWLAACCWIALLARYTILTLTTLTAFDGLTAQYLSPCYYLFTLSLALTTYLGVEIAASFVRTWKIDSYEAARFEERTSPVSEINASS